MIPPGKGRMDEAQIEQFWAFIDSEKHLVIEMLKVVSWSNNIADIEKHLGYIKRMLPTYEIITD